MNANSKTLATSMTFVSTDMAALESATWATFPKDYPMTCQVPHCGKELLKDKSYYQRYRVCKAHTRESSVMMHGSLHRFCQQCGVFELLTLFDGEKRSCRARLAVHNNRRRKLYMSNDELGPVLGEDESAASSPATPTGPRRSTRHANPRAPLTEPEEKKQKCAAQPAAAAAASSKTGSTSLVAPDLNEPAVATSSDSFHEPFVGFCEPFVKETAPATCAAGSMLPGSRHSRDNSLASEGSSNIEQLLAAVSAAPLTCAATEAAVPAASQSVATLSCQPDMHASRVPDVAHNWQQEQPEARAAVQTAHAVSKPNVTAGQQDSALTLPAHPVKVLAQSTLFIGSGPAPASMMLPMTLAPQGANPMLVARGVPTGYQLPADRMGWSHLALRSLAKVMPPGAGPLPLQHAHAGHPATVGAAVAYLQQPTPGLGWGQCGSLDSMSSAATADHGITRCPGSVGTSNLPITSNGGYTFTSKETACMDAIAQDDLLGDCAAFDLESADPLMDLPFTG